MTLIELLQLDRDGRHIVARGESVTVSRDELRRCSARIAAVLPEAAPRSQVALAFGHDRAAFAAALLATWSRGHTAAVAENASRARILPVLQHPDTVAMLHDTDSGRAHQVPRLLAAAGTADDPIDLDTPWPEAGDRPVLACAIRDADGSEAWLTWSVQQLRSELERLASTLPHDGDGRIAHDFTPGFPPALLAACLLPLSRGTAIDLDRPADPAALARQSRQRTTGALLCSARSVALLADLPEDLPTGAVAADCPVVCPSPVPSSTRERAPFEVRPLAIAAPFDVDAHAVDTSLDALRRIDRIDDVGAVRLPSSAGVLLVIVSGPGAEAVAAAPPPPIAAHATMRIRACADVPRDANRQLLPEAIFLLFGFGRAGQVVTRELTFSRRPDEDPDAAAAATGVCLRTELPSNYVFFEGHFTGYPVTAGAVQLHELVLPCLRALCGGELPPLQGLDGVKFLARFGPGDTIDVVLRRDQDARRIAFEIRRGTQRCTAGRATFVETLPAFVPQGAAR